MEESDSDLSEWQSWVVPSASLNQIKAIIANETTAKAAILGRLKGSQIGALAKSSAKSSVPNHPFGVTRILAEFWNNLSSHTSFWDTGDFSTKVVKNHTLLTFQFFGVRFNPVDLQRMFDDLGGIPAVSAFVTPPLAPTINATVPVATKLAVPPKPISDSHLRAWWAFYQAVTPDSEDTEPYATKHFERCFPGHKVPRQKIRNLRGTRKSGPKPKTAE